MVGLLITSGLIDLHGDEEKLCDFVVGLLERRLAGGIHDELAARGAGCGRPSSTLTETNQGAHWQRMRVHSTIPVGYRRTNTDAQRQRKSAGAGATSVCE
jgi:hypothetical protein